MTEPVIGVADGAAAEATGAANAPRDRAIAVAAKILVILIDIAYPSIELKPEIFLRNVISFRCAQSRCQTRNHQFFRDESRAGHRSAPAGRAEIAVPRHRQERPASKCSRLRTISVVVSACPVGHVVTVTARLSACGEGVFDLRGAVGHAGRLIRSSR
jgi:hypothetical protein